MTFGAPGATVSIPTVASKPGLRRARDSAKRINSAAPASASRRKAIGVVPAWPARPRKTSRPRVCPAIAETTPKSQIFSPPEPAPARCAFQHNRSARSAVVPNALVRPATPLSALEIRLRRAPADPATRSTAKLRALRARSRPPHPAISDSAARQSARVSLAPELSAGKSDSLLLGKTQDFDRERQGHAAAPQFAQGRDRAKGRRAHRRSAPHCAPCRGGSPAAASWHPIGAGPRPPRSDQ